MLTISFILTVAVPDDIMKSFKPEKSQSTSATIWRNAEYPIARLRSKRKKKER